MSYINTLPLSHVRISQVYVCISELERTYQDEMIDEGIEMKNAAFLFDAERSWVFPETVKAEPSRNAQTFNGRYMHFSEDFKELIIAKEEAGLCFWFRCVKQPYYHVNYCRCISTDNVPV